MMYNIFPGRLLNINIFSYIILLDENIPGTINSIVYMMKYGKSKGCALTRCINDRVCIEINTPGLPAIGFRKLLYYNAPYTG